MMKVDARIDNRYTTKISCRIAADISTGKTKQKILHRKR
jgi:hypothetical protein